MFSSFNSNSDVGMRKPKSKRALQDEAKWGNYDKDSKNSKSSKAKNPPEKEKKQWPMCGTVIEEEFQLLEKIGRGAFGTVYRARGLNPSFKVAIKIERRKYHKSETPLWQQFKWISSMESHDGIPKFYRHGVFQIWKFCIMELLGPNLSHVVDMTPSKKLQLHDISILGEKLLSILEKFHHNGFVHRDFKPGNTAVSLGGLNAQNDALYLIDFGFMSQFERNTKNFKKADWRVGTSLYMSVRCQKGYSQTPRDDLISLGYSLIDLHYGQLPWERLSSSIKNERIQMVCLKESMVEWDLDARSRGVDRFQGAPNMLVHQNLLRFLSICENTKPNVMPNYEQLRKVLRRLRNTLSDGFSPQFVEARRLAREAHNNAPHVSATSLESSDSGYNDVSISCQFGRTPAKSNLLSSGTSSTNRSSSSDSDI